MQRTGGATFVTLFVAVVSLVGLLVVAHVESVDAEAMVGLELVAEGFNSPVHLVSPPDGSGRRFVVDRIGVVHIVTAAGDLMRRPFLDVRHNMVSLMAGFDERGLLGFAFHPDFKDNRKFYVYYSAPKRASAPASWDHTSRVSEFTASLADPNRADPTSERVVLEVDQPQFNHNAGALAFGPDGYLYIAFGDGGGGNDDGVGHSPGGNAQDINVLLGKILRIDVDGGGVRDRLAYGIPQDNPFVGKEGRGEIYAWGFRNPFRIAFDRGGNHDLFVADVGQNLWEEVNIVRPGNYGWRIKEGTHWFDPKRPNAVITEGPSVGPRGELLQDPIVEYRNTKSGGNGAGISIIGGYVYRGAALPALYGKYVFADWSKSFGRGSGSLLVAVPAQVMDPSAASGELWPWHVLKNLDVFVLGMGEDSDGELYVLTSDEAGPVGNTGKVFRIVPSAP